MYMNNNIRQFKHSTEEEKMGIIDGHSHMYQKHVAVDSLKKTVSDIENFDIKLACFATSMSPAPWIPEYKR